MTSNYTNSPLATYTRITDKKTKRKGDGVIDTITIHCYVGQVTAKQGVDRFYNTDRDCSVQYVVGTDGSIGQSVEEEYRAWTSGGADKNGNPIRVNGISGADNDHRAVTIEVASDTTAPYAVTDAAYEALIVLCADICKRNGIESLKWEGDKTLVGDVSRQNMTVHRWFARKACPGDYLYERMGDIAARVNALLSEPQNCSVSVVCPCCGKSINVTLSPVVEAPVAPREYKVGDIVTFKGDTHYTNANASTGYKCTGGSAEITDTYAGGKHPYHLVRVNGKGATVYGWVDAGTFE